MNGRWLRLVDKVLKPDEKFSKQEVEGWKNLPDKIDIGINERPEVIDMNLLKEYLDINYKEELLALKNDDTYYIDCEDKYIRGLYLKYGNDFLQIAREAIMRMLTKNRQGDAKQLDFY